MDEDVDENTKPAKTSDPNDLSAYNLDEYDEESAGAGEQIHSNPLLVLNLRKLALSLMLAGWRSIRTAKMILTSL